MFKIKSNAFQNGYIQDKYGKRSVDVQSGVPQISFPLYWDNPPEGTVSFSIVFQDYDNIPDEGFSWIHWLVADIPSSINMLDENESRINKNLIQGRNSWMCPFAGYNLDESLTDYYGGPSPEKDHEYELVVYALDSFLGLKKGFYYNELRNKMEGHILDKAVLKGKYKG
jgi:Raf kinase inhibitor-like YbhB/YbcL family protein